MTDPAGWPMTAHEKSILRDSFAALDEYSDSVLQLFYGRLFEIDPATRSMFKISIPEQSRKLLEMLNLLIESLDRPELLRPKLLDLGRKHVSYGVKKEHYQILQQALLWAFGRALEGSFDRETKHCWSKLISAVAHIMIEGAESSG